MALRRASSSLLDPWHASFMQTESLPDGSLSVGLMAIEAFADGRGQVLAGDRLLNKADPRIEAPLVNNGVPRISGHEQDFQVGPALDSRFRQFPAVHPRHDDVGQKQSDA